MHNTITKRYLQPALKIAGNLLILASLLLNGLPGGTAQAAAPKTGADNLAKAPLFAPSTSTSLSIYPLEHTMIGEDFDFMVSFANPNAEAGYGPFIDLIFPSNGIDGAPKPDGITFVGASFKSFDLTPGAVTLTFPDDPTTPGSGCVNHPFALDNTGTPLQVCGTAGDTLVVLPLPFSSVTSAMPALYVDVTAHISDLADVDKPLTILGRSGFRYGADSLDNPSTDPAIVNPTSNDGSGWDSLDITPHVIEISKSYDGPKECPYLDPDTQVFDPSLCPYGDVNPVYETVSGPTNPHNYVISVHVAAVAATHPITNLDVTDYIPNNIAVLSTPGIATGGGTLNTAPTYDVAADSNLMVVRFASISADVSITVPFFVPQFNGDTPLPLPVLDPTTGAPTVADNYASALGNWVPIDVRDQPAPAGNAVANGPCSNPAVTSPTCAVLNELNIRSIAVQKSVSIDTDKGTNGYSAGDILKYTLDFQLSDYFSYGDLLLTDQMTDGQTLVTNPLVAPAPVFSVHDKNTTLTNVLLVPTVYTSGVVPATPTPGTDTIVDETATANVPGPNLTNYTSTIKFFISTAMTNAGAADGVLQGAVVTTDTTPATGEVVFYATINESFSDTYAGKDAFVDHGDVFYNVVTAEGTIRDNSTPTTVLSSLPNPSDESVQKFEIAHGDLTKTVYAVNGTLFVPTLLNPYPIIQPKDTITFELTQTLPSSDSEDLTLTDYVPMPILDATQVATFDAGPGSITAPAAGHAKFGPGNTLAATGAPTITTDGTGNTIVFEYGGFNDASDTSTISDILYTVTMNDKPYADDATLTNLATGLEDTTNTPDPFDLFYIDAAQFIIHEPAMTLSHGVVSSSNAGATFTPAPPFPPVGITFAAPGSNPSWTGTFTSANNNPPSINSDVSTVNSGDLLTFAIVLENLGHSSMGAFGVTVKDTLPNTDLVIPPGGLNLQVRRGDGSAPGFSGSLFGSGIVITDPSSTVGGVAAYSPSTGANIIIITYDLALAPGLPASTQIINNANLVSFSSTSTGLNFVGATVTPNVYSDDATVTLPDAAPVILEGANANINMDENNSPTPFSLTLHATDPNNDSLTWSIMSQPVYATASVNPAGVVSYAPMQNFSGADSFVVQVSDGTLSDHINVNVNVKSHLINSNLIWNQSYGIQYDSWIGTQDGNAFGDNYRKARTGSFTMAPPIKFTKFTWLTYTGPDQGKARVFVDGVYRKTVDLYSATPSWQFPVVISGLGNRSHTIQIKPLNTHNAASSDSWVVVDGFKIGATMYDDNYIRVSGFYSYGNWLGLRNVGTRFKAYRISSIKNATMSFSFLGTRFNWVTSRGPNYGKAVVYVDGAPVKTVDLYSPTLSWQQRIVFQNLPYGNHVITIKVLHSKNPASKGFGVVSDGFEID